MLNGPSAPKPIVLNVGITGHRSAALTAPLVRMLNPVVAQVFRRLRAATLELQESEDGFCSVTPAELRLHTGLASGADQIAAKCARSSGYVVRALLPFDADEYRNDFTAEEDIEEFEKALEAADEIVVLPGDRSEGPGAYVHAGKLLIEAADVLVAVWDGERARGPGGTAEVVELALKNAIPVIHIVVEPGAAKVKTRALIGGDAANPIGASLRKSDHYSRILRDALKASAAAAQVPAEREPATVG